MTEKCTYCEVHVAAPHGRPCGWCQAVLAKAGKESTAAECYERARWERHMSRRVWNTPEQLRLGSASVRTAHQNAAAAYQKLGDAKRTTDPRYIMFVAGMVISNGPTYNNFEKQWYSGEELRRPEGWYHVDETMTELYGPFDTDVEADQSMKRYIASIQRPETD